MEVEIEYETKNTDPIMLVFIGEAEYSSCNSDCGYNDGEVIGISGNFFYQSSGKAVGELVSKFLWKENESYLMESAGDI